MSGAPIPCFFHSDQLDFKPRYEWAFGEKIEHPETTARADKILAALEARPDFYELQVPNKAPLTDIRRLHNYNLVTLYNAACQLPQGHTFYPSVFLRERTARVDPTNVMHAGHFCFDSGTPLNRQTLNAASWSAACAISAAETVRRGTRLAFALSRPPGHHATRNQFGGYCYFNNTALAARRLRRDGRVAVVDIDFHHGNGTQSIFWRDGRVLTISVHGDPREFFPFFVGYPAETGGGAGSGFNLNLPLPAKTDSKEYVRTLEQHVIPAIAHFDPVSLVVAAGVDTYERDPIGDFGLKTDDFRTIGEIIGKLKLPTAAIMEGGYYTPHIGRNVDALLDGLRLGQGEGS
jgi:acetoin utilization deacetylase AcuC-like enzyme